MKTNKHLPPRHQCQRHLLLRALKYKSILINLLANSKKYEWIISNGICIVKTCMRAERDDPKYVCTYGKPPILKVSKLYTRN